MQWIELSLKTTQEAIDWVRTLLATVDYSGQLEISRLDVEESRAGSLAAPPSTTPWSYSVRLALPNDAQAMGRAEAIHRLLAPLHRTGLTTELEIERLEQPLLYAAPVQPHWIEPRFVVLPPDLPYSPQSNELLLRLETTLAFGSGLHPATILSLQLLERYVVPGMKTLDLGSGSGILSLAMARMGAVVWAMDNDPIAVTATQKAVQLNQLEDQVTVKHASLGSGSTLGHWMGGDGVAAVPALDPTLRFNLIAANILSRIHITLASDYRQVLQVASDSGSSLTSGILVISGFTIDQLPDIENALAEVGFAEIDRIQSGGWIACAYR